MDIDSNVTESISLFYDTLNHAKEGPSSVIFLKRPKERGYVNESSSEDDYEDKLIAEMEQ